MNRYSNEAVERFDQQFAETSDERAERFARRQIDPLFQQLFDLTRNWNSFEDVPRSQQIECRQIGEKLHADGGIEKMRSAYYAAKERNLHVHVIQAYWDKVGDWRW
jgi:hypothetical protein